VDAIPPPVAQAAWVLGLFTALLTITRKSDCLRAARAWAELSGALQGSMTFGADPAVALPASLAAARRAVEIDPGDAMAHALLAFDLAMQGNFAPSEAEFDRALRLNPGDAELLALYSPWASTFGHPERGAEAADHAIRLNPNYLPWQAWNFSSAYFPAGRFEDALGILERLPKDNYNFYAWVYRAASYAALGRSAEAKAAVSDALSHFPDLTIEGFAGTVDWSDADRKRLIGPMHAAGFRKSRRFARTSWWRKQSCRTGLRWAADLRQAASLVSVKKVRLLPSRKGC
jgi:tetratricopeptide (TPR) repeat protein